MSLPEQRPGDKITFMFVLGAALIFLSLGVLLYYLVFFVEPSLGASSETIFNNRPLCLVLGAAFGIFGIFCILMDGQLSNVPRPPS